MGAKILPLSVKLDRGVSRYGDQFLERIGGTVECNLCHKIVYQSSQAESSIGTLVRQHCKTLIHINAIEEAGMVQVMNSTMDLSSDMNNTLDLDMSQGDNQTEESGVTPKSNGFFTNGTNGIGTNGLSKNGYGHRVIDDGILKQVEASFDDHLDGDDVVRSLKIEMLKDQAKFFKRMNSALDYFTNAIPFAALFLAIAALAIFVGKHF